MYNTEKPYTEDILKLIQQTWETPYVSVREGAYPIIQKKFSHPEIDHTDGIGTKGVYHWEKRTFKNAVLDALAMNLNDMAMARATPYKLQNNIFVPEDDHHAILEIVKSLVEECKKRNIAITGGETAIHDTMKGLEISITVSGFLEAEKQNRAHAGDVLVGFKSNGLHSNGFTKIREVFGEEVREEFTEPTKIYLDTIFELEKRFDIHGMMHITGGAYTKLKGLLAGVDAKIKRGHCFKPQEIFQELYRRGVSDEDMYKTFNCGVGFVLSVPPVEARKIVSLFDEAEIIGEVVAGKGRVRIESYFSDKKVTF